MNKRLLMIAVIFVVGLGVGFGLTWLVVGGSGPSAGDEAGGLVAASEGPTVPGTPEPVAPDLDVTGAADAATEPGESDAVTPEAKDDAVLAPPGDPEVGADTADEAVEPAPPATLWWKACHNTRCRVNFGRVRGGLSIRRGKITHNEEVEWTARFGDAPRIGVLPDGDATVVTLHAVGMQHGLPTAAWVTWQGDDEAITGMIALVIGDKQVTLEPL